MKERILILTLSILLIACDDSSGPSNGNNGPVNNPSYEILISSSQSNSIKRYDGSTGAYIDNFIDGAAVNMQNLQEVIYAPDGNLLVSAFAGTGQANIVKFNGQTGAFISVFSSGYTLNQATKMVIGPDSLLYVSQWNGAKVVTFDIHTGAFIREVTNVADNTYMGQAWDKDGTLTIVSWRTDGVTKFDSTGNPTAFTIAPGHLVGPVNVWYDEDNVLYVLDWTSGDVERFNGETGAYLGRFVSGLNNAEGMAFGPEDGMLYICDWAANRVNKYNPTTGSFITQMIKVNSNGGMNTPNSILFKLK